MAQITKNAEIINTVSTGPGIVARGGHVRLWRPWYAGPGGYVATELGARVGGLGLPAPRWARLSIGHHLTVADVARALLAEQLEGAA